MSPAATTAFAPRPLFVPLDRAQGCPRCGRPACLIIARQIGALIAWVCNGCDVKEAA